MNNYMEEAVDAFMKALDRLISEGLDIRALPDLADYFAYVAFHPDRDGRGVAARLAQRMQPGTVLAPEPAPEPVPEAQEPAPEFTEAELNRLRFYRQLVNAGRLTEEVFDV